MGNGIKLIYSDMLTKLMDIFDVTCDYLLKRTDKERFIDSGESTCTEYA